VCFLSTRLIMVEKYREMGRKTTNYYHDWFGIEPLYVVESSGTSPMDPHFCRQPAAVMVKHASGHSICRGAHYGHSARRAADRRPLKSSICCQINRNALMRLSSFCSVVHIQQYAVASIPGGGEGVDCPPPNKNIPGREYLFAPSKF